MPQSSINHQNNGETIGNNFFHLPAFNSINITEPDALLHEQSIATDNSVDFYQKKSDYL
jgi:hypothetical protein